MKPLRIIDAFSGRELRIGERFTLPTNEIVRLVAVEPGWFSADAIVEHASGVHDRVHLIVRYTHPSFLGQRVAFLPT